MKLRKLISNSAVVVISALPLHLPMRRSTRTMDIFAMTVARTAMRTSIGAERLDRGQAMVRVTNMILYSIIRVTSLVARLGQTFPQVTTIAPPWAFLRILASVFLVGEVFTHLRL